MTTTMTNSDNQKASSEFKSIFDQRTCARRGMCPVTQIHHPREPLESHSLYFEVHGNGPQKIVFIMGMNNSCFTWLPQVDHFGKLERYSTLVFDNRGVGMSETPRGPYSTSRMAEDLICLLDYLEWTEDRSLHIVGVSLGGMISQELAYRIPNRIMSLGLVVTRAGGSTWANMPSLSAFLRFARLLFTSDPNKKIPLVEQGLYPREWLDALAEDDPEGRTNREIQHEVLRHRMEITKPQALTGALGQIAAALTHSMAPDHLSQVSRSVPKVLILSATEDLLIPYMEGEKLKRHMPEAEYQCWEKTGHGVSTQYPQRFNRLLEKLFEEGKEAVGERVYLN